MFIARFFSARHMRFQIMTECVVEEFVSMRRVLFFLICEYVMYMHVAYILYKYRFIVWNICIDCNGRSFLYNTAQHLRDSINTNINKKKDAYSFSDDISRAHRNACCCIVSSTLFQFIWYYLRVCNVLHYIVLMHLFQTILPVEVYAIALTVQVMCNQCHITASFFVCCHALYLFFLSYSLSLPLL